MAIDKDVIEEALDRFERIRICGEIKCELPQPPPFRKIDNYDKKKSAQMFRYIDVPEDVDDLMDSINDGFIEREYNRIYHRIPLRILELYVHRW
jgi:hypothetical protein